MKKIILLFILVFASSVLVACDNQSGDDTLSVVFFTGPGATHVPTAYDLKVGGKIPLPEEPTSDAADFVAWYKEPECINEWDFENETLSKSITLYAKWDYFVFTITYDLRGGYWPEDLAEGTYPTTYTYLTEVRFPTGTKVIPISPKDDPNNPFRGLFLGWWLEPNMTAEELRNTPKTESIPKGSTGDIVLYAYYTRDRIF
jgi:hypothetical protein